MNHGADLTASRQGRKVNALQLIRSIPLFSILSGQELESFAGIVSQRCFPKGSIILMEEDTPNYMYIVFSGKAKVVQTNPNGREHILAIHKKGDFFGEMSLLDGKTSPATVIAMENSTVGLIARTNFERFLMTNERVRGNIIDLLCARLRDAWLKIRVLSFADAEQRVRAVLHEIGTLHGVRDDRGIIVNLKITHRDIASHANLSRETVTRLLNRFRADGEIELVDNRKILLRPVFNGRCTFPEA